jgi:hypothetical protein
VGREARICTGVRALGQLGSPRRSASPLAELGLGASGQTRQGCRRPSLILIVEPTMRSALGKRLGPMVSFLSPSGYSIAVWEYQRPLVK